MAEVVQVPGDERGGVAFVGRDRVADLLVGVVIDHHHRNLAVAQLPGVVVVGEAERRPEDQAVYPPIEQPVHQPDSLLFVGFEVGHVLDIPEPDRDRKIIRLGEPGMDACQHRHPEGVIGGITTPMVRVFPVCIPLTSRFRRQPSFREAASTRCRVSSLKCV